VEISGVFVRSLFVSFGLGLVCCNVELVFGFSSIYKKGVLSRVFLKKNIFCLQVL
jgi:hypothetical protein